MDILGPHLPLIGRSPLFDGICADDLEALLSCLGARTRAFSKGTAVLRRGNVTTHMGMVLEGAVRETATSSRRSGRGSRSPKCTHANPTCLST